MIEQNSVTEEEKHKVLSAYFKNGIDGEMTAFPSKEKRKLIVLQHILKRFKPERTYSEKEVNELLKTAYSDFVIIRRSLIEYHLMDRSRDCSQYWIKNEGR